ncbi:FMRFamide receptor [Octopus bimaculoides]|uniref:G-protein coupled receptors family 1 profile domain-containing protein n=1 Tax=Octopus bimaculoides TaxID=37653 RepID=A0A0L8HU66_OCTBM|nr:FMRFamide receptor [Octopus bimaculoides]|eukprot:XP_014769345.1 PREDICTED: FMRFamide receptor-like [Octopus bimaculoides]
MTYKLYFFCVCAVLFTKCMPGVLNLPTDDLTTENPEPVTTIFDTYTATQEAFTSKLEDVEVEDEDEQDQPQNRTQINEDIISAMKLRKMLFLNITPVVCALGILGNIMNLIVLCQKQMRGSTNCFLIALAVSDMMLLVMQIGPLIASFENFVGYSRKYIIASRYLMIIRYVTSNFFITCTSWLTVAVTIERFIAIRFALKAKIMCTVYRAKVAIVTIFITSFVFHFSKWFEYGVNFDHTKPNPVIFMPLSHSKAYMSFMHSTNIAIAVFIPEISLSILNTLLVFYLVKHNASTQHMKKQTSQEIAHITTVVITMVLVFMMCHSIGLYLAISISIYGRSSVLSTPTGISLRAINNLLVLINSSVNFILYTAISQRFRSTMKGIFLRYTKPGYKLPRGQGGSASASSSKTKSTSSSNSKRSTKESVV